MAKRVCFIIFIAFVATIILAIGMATAQKKPNEPLSIKLEGGKLPPVNFSHTTHTDKAKAECIKCHHKDKDTNSPEPCIKCHLINEVKDNALKAKDAYHKNCIDCHKESVAKGTLAPTKCNECHKKQ